MSADELADSPAAASGYVGTWAWALVEDDLTVVGHVYPDEDIIEHQIAAGSECPCGGRSEGFRQAADGRHEWDQQHRPAPAGFRDGRRRDGRDGQAAGS